jgi:hypothetical protein
MIFANPDWQDLIHLLVNQLPDHSLQTEILNGFPSETVSSDCGQLALRISNYFQSAKMSGKVDDLWNLLHEHEQRLESFIGQDQFVKDLIFVLPIKPAKLRALVRYGCSRLGESHAESISVIRRMMVFWPEVKADILARLPRNIDSKIVGDDLNSMLMFRMWSR